MNAERMLYVALVLLVIIGLAREAYLIGTWANDPEDEDGEGNDLSL